MSNTKPIYCSDCRFTDTAVTVAHHGHGVSVSLGFVNADSCLSRFLTEAQAHALVDALLRAGFGTRAAPPEVPGYDRLHGRITAVESDLAELRGRLHQI
jgi:hypothetical protein